MASPVVQLIAMCDRAFRVLEKLAPPPQLVQTQKGPLFRCLEQTPEQAVIQKVARTLTSMRAILKLLHAGLYQEVGVLFRVLDELSEDVIFLSRALIDAPTDLHKEYLSGFYQEEFDNLSNPLTSTQNRPSVPRRKFHAAIAAIPESPVNKSDSQELHRTLSKTFSGYVHAASVHVMDMVGGQPAEFHIAGMLGTPRQAEFEAHAVHYFYRGLVTVMYAAVAFKQEELLRELYRFRDYFESQSRMTTWPDPDKQVRDLRKGT